MPDNDNENERLNLLAIKNQLVNLSVAELVERYRDIDEYYTFLETLIKLINTESTFLLCGSDYIDKVVTIVNIHRFDVDDKDFRLGVSGIISYFNSVRSQDSNLKEILKAGYVSYQEDQRGITFYDMGAMLKSIAYDANVYQALQKGTIEKLGLDDYTLMSLTYLMNVYPEFFKDKNVNARAVKLIDSITSKTRFLSPSRRFAKYVEKVLEKVSKEGE